MINRATDLATEDTHMSEFDSGNEDTLLGLQDALRDRHHLGRGFSGTIDHLGKVFSQGAV